MNVGYSGIGEEPVYSREEFLRDRHCDKAMNKYRDEVRRRLSYHWNTEIEERFFYNVIIRQFQNEDEFEAYLEEALDLDLGHKYAMYGQDDMFWKWWTTPGKGADEQGVPDGYYEI